MAGRVGRLGRDPRAHPRTWAPSFRGEERAAPVGA
jgi:hypothetical protein